MRWLLPLLILVLFGCSTQPPVISPSASSTKSCPLIPVWVLNHGWHTGIVVSAADLNQRLPDLASRFGTPTYYEIGWGDKGFYQAAEITTGLTLKALFWPTEAVMHLVAFNQPAAEYFIQSDVQMITISETDYTRLLDFIQHSFALNASQQLIPQRQGLYGDSQFYNAVGNYYVFNTCNKWTAKALYSAAVDINPLFKLTASSVMSAAKKQDTTDECGANLVDH